MNEMPSLKMKTHRLIQLWFKKTNPLSRPSVLINLPGTLMFAQWSVLVERVCVCQHRWDVEPLFTPLKASLRKQSSDVWEQRADQEQGLWVSGISFSPFCLAGRKLHPAPQWGAGFLLTVKPLTIRTQ